MRKGTADTLKLGLWNAICDECGFKFKSNQLKKRWDGAMTCKECWEPRHPQDYIKSVPDRQAVPWVRSVQADTFITAAPADPDSL